MRRLALALLLPALLLLTAHEEAGRSAASSGIVATFLVVDETFRAHIENPDTIEQVLALQRGESSATIPVGALRPGEEYNTGWSWHTDSWEIEMAEVAIEVCDGLPSFVEANLDYWLNTVGTYCPWNAELVGVVLLGGVGGVADLPVAARRPLAINGGLDVSVRVVAGVAAGIVAGLGGAFLAWRARRKRASS